MFLANFFMVDSDDNNLYFESGISLLSCLTIELVFSSSTSVARFNLILWMFNGSHYFKEPAEIVCHCFKPFNRGYILLELEMIIFLHMIFKLFFNVTGFAHLLRMFARFYNHF